MVQIALQLLRPKITMRPDDSQIIFMGSAGRTAIALMEDPIQKQTRQDVRRLHFGHCKSRRPWHTIIYGFVIVPFSIWHPRIHAHGYLCITMYQFTDSALP
jgi:hypothetical protein